MKVILHNILAHKGLTDFGKQVVEHMDKIENDG